MALHLHRAERTDLLADGLAEMLAGPLDDPFEQEVVVVPAKGVERWLTQRLSHRLGTGPRGGDGVCAGVRFLTPHSLVAMLLDRERDDPWHPDRLVWPVLEVIDDSLGEPWCSTLAAHLGHGLTGEEGDLRRNRRWSVARRLAGLLAGYAQQRPGTVTDWREGRDTDGAGATLPPDLAWQAELWRRVVARVAAPPPDVRLEETVARLETGADGLDLPGRLSLFGHTRLTVADVRLLSALGRRRDVHLWLPQASPALWRRLADSSASGPVRRHDDRSAGLVRHPLLASLGRDARELQRTLGSVPAVDAELPVEPHRPTTLLGLLQSDLRADRMPTPDERAGRVVAADDRSVQVHACHGPSRQVDVLREVLVGLLEDDPTLEPRDIVVMCPDVETYAPLISAGFGLADVVEDRAHPAHRLRVQLADRALSSTNPLLGLAVTLVELAGGRVTASEVLDLLATEPVRERFALSDDDLARVAHWIGDAGVRWGLDVDQRARFSMERFGHNTWRSGLDRILVGVAMSGDGYPHLAHALPVDDVGSGDIELAGRLAELTDRLDACLRALGAAATTAEWMTAIGAGVASLAAVPEKDAWQVAQLDRELSRAVAAGGPELRLADVRALLASRLAGRPTRANFRTGTLTVCTMVPMRSVPHRVVCLLGLDDGVFPRTLSVDGDDVLARDPMTGERDVRSEDRQLLLDAVLAAHEKLVVCYTGANEHSGAVRPPAVPLDELLDAVRATASGPGVDAVLERHPLQPYDGRNFAAGAPFSFDVAALAGARAGATTRVVEPPFLPGPLPPPPPEDLTLADLKDFLAHPVREFVRDRLLVGKPLDADDVRDAIPIELDALERWAIGDRLLADVVAGVDHVAALTAEQLRGTLPPGRIGTTALEAICREVQDLHAATAPLREDAPRTYDVRIPLGGERRLTGTVTGVHGAKVVSLGYSRLGAKQRLAAWVDLLALSVAFPDRSWTSHAVGKSRAGPTRALAGPLDHRAEQWLRDLVSLHDEGQTRPLPAPVKTAQAWAEAQARAAAGRPVSPYDEARRQWVTDPNNAFGIPGEDADAWHERAFGRGAALDVLVDAGLPDVAWRIWEPLVTGAEKVGPL